MRFGTLSGILLGINLGTFPDPFWMILGTVFGSVLGPFRIWDVHNYACFVILVGNQKGDK